MANPKAIRVFRAPKATACFVVLRNETLQNSALSYGARGLLAAVLSQPVTFEHAIERLKTEREGKHVIRRLLNELTRAGYHRCVSEQGKAGRRKHIHEFSELPRADWISPPSCEVPRAAQGGDEIPSTIPKVAKDNKPVLAKDISPCSVFRYDGQADDKKERTDKEQKKGRNDEMRLGAEPAPNQRFNDILDSRRSRTLPTDVSTVIDLGEWLGIEPETAVAFWNYQEAKGWKTSAGRPLRFWGRALRNWSRRDDERILKSPTTISLKEALKIAKDEDIPKEVVSAWLHTMKLNCWSIHNPLTDRMEPLRDPRAALIAFNATELNELLVDYETR